MFTMKYNHIQSQFSLQLPPDIFWHIPLTPSTLFLLFLVLFHLMKICFYRIFTDNGFPSQNNSEILPIFPIWIHITYVFLWKSKDHLKNNNKIRQKKSKYTGIKQKKQTINKSERNTYLHRVTQSHRHRVSTETKKWKLCYVSQIYGR